MDASSQNPSPDHEWTRLADLAAVEQLVRRFRVDQIIFLLPPEHHRHLFPLLARLAPRPVRLRVVAPAPPPPGLGFTWEAVGNGWLVDLWTPALPGWQRRLKRLVDVCASGIGLLLAAPLLAVIALAIKLEDGGPVFYQSRRVGENCRAFDMLKFRSMQVDADRLVSEGESSPTGTFYKREDDPRVTRVGRFLRRTSLDELPQLWNILVGDMSLVGPRPELPWLLERHPIWNWPRFAVPQGLTGWWQVNSRAETPGQYLHPEDDLYYARRCSPWLDLRILWRTVAVVLQGKGAY
ncbi:MAG: exopolysaccharide biosynthesis polyprenyl glycosylphosphotransferase [Caldilineae bacterium]|nr:MAG: exopolysaccharide biosynthesis polyprenyl glycosylphosphotransferase [Caldilineae bacterium]